ncbi:MAG: creatininase family protein [Desulfobacteraceae bacterium]|nr:MAG: creatininase family protein [Desulfobacteraceae bacterium]
MTWEEAGKSVETGNGIILLPVGSTEQHGPHLPLGTDTMVAAAIAQGAAEKASVPVAPPLWFGWSPHHMILPGTITIRPEILSEAAFDVISSLHQHGFDKFILINGHRIVNITWLQIAGERAKREFGVKVVIFDPAHMSKSVVKDLGWGAVGHAEEIETSQMLYCHPELVKLDRAIDNPHGPARLYSVDPNFKDDTLCYVPSSPEEMKAHTLESGGTTGEPTKADAKGGKVYHDHLVERLVQVIRMLA